MQTNSRSSFGLNDLALAEFWMVVSYLFLAAFACSLHSEANADRNGYPLEPAGIENGTTPKGTVNPTHRPHEGVNTPSNGGFPGKPNQPAGGTAGNAAKGSAVVSAVEGVEAGATNGGSASQPDGNSTTSNSASLGNDDHEASHDELVALRKMLKKRDAELNILRSENSSLLSKIDELREDVALVNFENAELASLNDDLSAVNVALAEDNLALNIEVAVLRYDKQRLAAEKQSLLKAVSDLSEQNKSLYDENQDLVAQLAATRGRIARHNEGITRPLTNAPVCVKIRSTSALFEQGYDLDLFVQEPNDSVCYWKRPRVFDMKGERATLVPSENLRSIRLLEDETTLYSEEIFYARELFKTTPDPYLVFGQIRRVGGVEQNEDLKHHVDFDVVLRDNDGVVVHKHAGTVQIPTGAVTRSADGERYPGLVPLTGFRIIDGATQPKIREVTKAELPEVLRGWSLKPQSKNATPIPKLADPSR